MEPTKEQLKSFLNGITKLSEETNIYIGDVVTLSIGPDYPSEEGGRYYIYKERSFSYNKVYFYLDFETYEGIEYRKKLSYVEEIIDSNEN